MLDGNDTLMRKQLRIPGAMLALMLWVSPVLWAPATLCGQQQQSQAADAISVAALIEQLESSSYRERQQASETIVQRGQSAIPQIVESLQSASPEKYFRLKSILLSVTKGIDLDKFPQAVTALRRLARSESKTNARLASGILGPEFDPELGARLADWMQTAAKVKKIPELGDLYQQAKASDALLVSSANANRKQYWRDLKDVNANQEILMYRIKWFKGGWSPWFVPGHNDTNKASPGKRNWNFFYDHQHEIVTIKVKRGPFRSRQAFLNWKKPANK